jgi:hypothetical protein
MLVVKQLLVTAACALALAGCGGDDSAAPADTEPALTWQGVSEPRPRDGVLEVEAFRSHTEAVDAEFEREPEALVRKYLGVGDGALIVDGPRATLLRDSLEDDSIRAERWLVDLEREGDVWAVAAARWEQRCHENRGHQMFSPELCV